MRISDWSSDVCSSDLQMRAHPFEIAVEPGAVQQQRGRIEIGKMQGRFPPIGLAGSRRRRHPRCVARRAAAIVQTPSIPIFPVRAVGFAVRAVRRPSSEERRLGTECVSTCRSRWSPFISKKHTLSDTPTNLLKYTLNQ